MADESRESLAKRAATDELVRSAAAGDAEAFEALIKGEETFMMGLAVGHCGDHERARDIVQEAMLAAWQKLRTLREPAAFHGWLGTIVIHRCVEAKRKRDRFVPLPEDKDFPGPAPTEAVLQNRQREDLLDGIRSLDEEKKMLLAMRYTENLGYVEIAERLGITVNAVRGRLHGAREILRAKLRRKSS